MNVHLRLPAPIPGQVGDVTWGRAGPAETGELDPRPDLLVVGAGLAGLAVAAAARRRGLSRVLVIDALGVATRASGRNAGALIPGAHGLTHSAAFSRLARRGLELHEQLHSRWSLPLRRTDWLVPLRDGEEPPPADLLAEHGAELVDQADVAARLRTETAIVRGILVRNQALTDPVRVASALAVEAGGVAAGVEALDVMLQAERVTEVATTAGVVAPGAVVLATGLAPDELIPHQSWVKGHLAVTAPAPFDLGATSVGGATIAIQLTDGRLLVGGTREADERGELRSDVQAQIRSELSWLLPKASHLPFERVWTAQRPYTGDALPVVDRVPGTANGYLVAGLHHSGLCTAPAIGEAVADAVLDGELPELVRPFAIRA